MFKFCKQKTKSSMHPAGSASRLRQRLATKWLVGDGAFSLTGPFCLYNRTNDGDHDHDTGLPGRDPISLLPLAIGRLGLRRKVAKRPIDNKGAKDAMWRDITRA